MNTTTRTRRTRAAAMIAALGIVTAGMINTSTAQAAGPIGGGPVVAVRAPIPFCGWASLNIWLGLDCWMNHRR